MFNPAYAILVNADGSINVAEVMKMAHRKTKQVIKDYEDYRKAKFPLSYAREFQTNLQQAWQWAKSIQEYNGRQAA